MNLNIQHPVLDAQFLNYVDFAKNFAASEGYEFNLPQMSPESIDALYSNAYNLYEKGNYKDAIHSFRLLTMSNAFERKFWIGLGASLQMNKFYKDAIQAYEVAALMDANDPYVHFHAAECLFLSNQLPRALDALDSAESVAKKNSKFKNLITQFALFRKTWSNQSKKVELKEQ